MSGSSQSQPVLPSNGQGSSEPSGAWRPIETAPEGEKVLLWCEDYFRSGTWPERFSPTERAACSIFFGRKCGDFFLCDGMGGGWNYTHWMPLPAPPESSAANGALERQDGQLRDEPNV